MQLVLPVTRVVTEAAVIGEHCRGKPGCGTERQVGPQPVIVVGAALQREGRRMRFTGLRQQYVDDAVQRTGTVQRITGSANDFDGARDFAVRLEQ